MPIGYQMIARPFEEELLLGAAHAYEQETHRYIRQHAFAAAAAAA
jgi:Asp-tRNA(Asn)/Glu-tRNA(Gln) amidotransferase A subunit family amidase